MNATTYLLCGLSALLFACGSPGDSDEAGEGGDDSSTGDSSGDPGPGVGEECGSVRMTEYTSSDRRWCGFDRNHPILPSFVREGMTVAVAEPYNGSSYGGEPGEACGECWRVDTSFGTEVVMVHDLCPVEGNPICAGSHFHFDVSGEVADAIDGGGWLGEAAVQRVPCPVDGNIHVYITARNEYGYMQVAFFNHRYPIRRVEYRAADGEEWLPMARCLARWCLEEDLQTFSDDGPGGVFRLTSANNEVVEGSAVLGFDVAEGADFDTGIQFAEQAPAGQVCEFTPPGDVYDEGYGGIPGVTWDSNTWGDTVLVETTEGCADGSASCLSLSSFEGSGLHLTYRHVFPSTTFATLSLQLRSNSGGGSVQVAPRTEDARCANPTLVEVSDEWTTAQIDVGSSCPDSADLHGLTVSMASGPMDLMLDEILFE